MSRISRRALIAGGVGVAAGVGSVAVAARLARRYGLVPPDSGGVYGPGETLTYAAQRAMTRRSLAREFSPSQISKQPFANEVAPLGDEFARLQKAGFAEWRLAVDGMVANPASFSVAEIQKFQQHRHITMIQCEEGWSYIGEWIGAPLSHVLEAAGVLPHARYVVYQSFQREWWDSIDMADALHPQTLITYGMNDGVLPVAFGGPLRMRVPRQLGYKSVKYLTRLTLTDDLKKFGKGLGSMEPEVGYSWYAGI